MTDMRLGGDQSVHETIEGLRTVGQYGAVEFTADEWAFFFGEKPEKEPHAPRWYGFITAALVLGLLGSSALIAWRVVADGWNDISDPVEVEMVARNMVDESPFGWLVTSVEVLPINNIDVGGYVQSSPADGVIVIDRRPWDKNELADVVQHEIGHLLDFALYQPGEVRRGGLESEVWAECASVNAGVRKTDGYGDDVAYRCSKGDLTVFRTALSLESELCAHWIGECRDLPST